MKKFEIVELKEKAILAGEGDRVLWPAAIYGVIIIATSNA